MSAERGRALSALKYVWESCKGSPYYNEDDWKRIERQVILTLFPPDPEMYERSMADIAAGHYRVLGEPTPPAVPPAPES